MIENENFDRVTEAIARVVCIVDMGDKFRFVCTYDPTEWSRLRGMSYQGILSYVKVVIAEKERLGRYRPKHLTVFDCTYENMGDYYTAVKREAVTMNLEDRSSDRLMHKKSISSMLELSVLLNSYFGCVRYNAVQLCDGIVSGSPYLEFRDARLQVLWSPHFEATPSKKYVKLLNGYFVYKYEKEVLVLSSESERHTVDSLKELMTVCLATGEIVCELWSIKSNLFRKGRYLYNAQEAKWVVLSENTYPVAGYKFRKRKQ